MSDSATAAKPPSAPGLFRSIAHRLAGDDAALPVEGHLASFDGHLEPPVLRLVVLRNVHLRHDFDARD